MKKATLLLLISLICGIGYAQTVTSTYQQSKLTGTFIPVASLSGTGTSFGSSWTGSASYTDSATLPFSFYFNGTSYSKCYINPNGYITFGAPSVSTNYTPLSTPSTGVTGTVSAFACNALQSANAVTYGYSGTAPNRIFSVVWRAARFTAGITSTTDTVTFEINLYETTNKAEAMFLAPPTLTSTGTVSVQLGIEGSTSADYYCWQEANINHNNCRYSRRWKLETNEAWYRQHFSVCA